MAQLDHTTLKRMVANAADLTSSAREASERDIDYYDGHQWTAQEIAALNERKQPIITINRIRRKIDAMVGIEQRSRVDPKAYPRNPQNEEQAEVATKALVFVDDNTRFDAKRSQAFRDMLVAGYSGVLVGVTEKRGKFEVDITRLRWEEIFFDPHSRELDFSDASYTGIQKWMSLDKAVELYSGAYQGEDLEELLSTSFTNPEDGETYEDRPFEGNSFHWSDKRQRRVRVAEMYYQRGGVWYLAIFAGGGEILNIQSPYIDEDGRPTNPMILMTGYIDRENNRYGVVRDWISAQDEINHRRSKLLHQLNSRTTMGVKGAVDSVAAMKRERDRPDGHIEINYEAFEDAARIGMRPFEQLDNTDQVQGQFALLTEAKSEIDMVGPNATLLGQSGRDQSGRAIMAQQQAGFAELAPIYDNLRDWTLRVYRAIWERVRQFWTEERWIRITNDMSGTEFVGLNIQQPPMITPMGIMQPPPQNPVAEMDLDIIIQDAPDYVTLRQEQFEQLTQMAQAGIPVPPEMLIEASDLKNKEKLIEAMQQQQQAAMQAQAGQSQAQAQLAQVKAQREQAAAMKDMASAGKMQAETRETEAETVKTVIEAQRAAMGF